MNVMTSEELEQLVRATFPSRARFSAESELGLTARKAPPVANVHGGPDPYLDRQFDRWLEGAVPFVSFYELLNRLCRAGALSPGDYAVSASGVTLIQPRSSYEQTNDPRPTLPLRAIPRN
jgi:hypothetical protein